MRKILLLFICCQFILSCEASLDTEPEMMEEVPEFSPCNFQGRTYKMTSYVYEIPVDFDNNGIYSPDIIDQTFCFNNDFPFNDTNGIRDLLSEFPDAIVTTDSNGNLVQQSGCTFSDGGRLSCFRNGEVVILTFGDNTVHEGILSNNDNTMTFIIPDERLRQYHLGFHQILNEDGTITNYDGTITVTLELQ